MTDVDIDRQKALRNGCRIFQQFTLVADKEANDIPHGQNIEALRIALNRLRNLFPDDFNDELDQMIAEGSEANKPS